MDAVEAFGWAVGLEVEAALPEVLLLPETVSAAVAPAELPDAELPDAELPDAAILLSSSCSTAYTLTWASTTGW